MNHFIIGTAGHIDHGKTALVKALTGMDTDRLKEEKERGITIDIGFAYWKEGITIIDVPGHERFIRNMVAGVSSIDFVLLAIAADDGIMPQTVEHMDILKLLHIQSGAIVITKTDLVSHARLDELETEIRDWASDTFLQDAAIFRISSVKNQGIDELRNHLEHTASVGRSEKQEGFFRMNIDRRFTVKGFGTVVTGTVLAGRVRVDDNVDLMPIGKQVRIRGLQRHQRDVKEVEAGDRAAINLSGIEAGLLQRGYLLAASGCMKTVKGFYATIHMLASAKRPLTKKVRARMHIGTAQFFCWIVPIDRAIRAAENGFVRIIPEEPMTCVRGDRFVLRETNSAATFGGGIVIDHVLADLNMQNGYLEAMESDEWQVALTHFVSFHKSTSLSQMTAVFGLETSQLESELDALEQKQKIHVFGGRDKIILDDRYFLYLNERITETLASFHQRNPSETGMKKSRLKIETESLVKEEILNELIRNLIAAGQIVDEKETLRLPNHRIRLPDRDQDMLNEIERRLRQNLFSPPSIEIIANDMKRPAQDVLRIAKIMSTMGTAVKTGENLYFHADAIGEARQFIIDFIYKNGHIKITDFKDRFHTSRKFALSLLEYFDSIQVTCRNGDSRVMAH